MTVVRNKVLEVVNLLVFTRRGALPSYAPTPEAGLNLEPFDCTINFHPVQVMKPEDEDYYSVMQLDPASGEYEEIYDLEHLITDDGHINAVDLWLDGDKYYVAGSVRADDDEDSKLCFFDSEGRVCYDEALEEVKANAGCILGDNFYYAKDLGEGERSVYWVEGIGSEEPIFHSKNEAEFVVNEDLFEKSVLDFVGISETVNEFIDDGEEERSYLVGLGQGFEVVVVRLKDDGTPESYAVLESEVGCVDTDNLGQPVDCDAYDDEKAEWEDEGETSAFGAAFNFRAPDWSMVQTYFASNEGWGIFELVYPLEVPDECWNSGEEDHSVCDEGAQLLWRMPSEKLKSNDGMNCPLGAGAPPEAQPSPQPVELVYAPTPQPQEETDDEPQYEAGVFDCDHHGNPVQVLREDDDEPYRVVELDASSGEYNLLYEMDYLSSDVHVNAVAMHSDGEGGYTALASIGGKVCLFDESGTECLAEALEVAKPNLGAVLGDVFYYAKEPGNGGSRRIYWVEDIVSEAPVFHKHADALFEIPTGLFTKSVLDFVAVDEQTVDWVVDDVEEASYLVGLAQRFEVLIVRLSTDGEPEAYAVLPGNVEWDEDPGDSSPFGAAFAYHSPTWNQLETFFASNEGWGIFELHWPLIVPDECWNTGFDTDSHEVCASTANLTRWHDSEESSSNDGMNCPLGHYVETYEPTLMPTTARPTPSPTNYTCSACWDQPVASLDCALHSGPLRLNGGAVVANGVTAADVAYFANANPGGLALYEAQDGAYALLAAGVMHCRVAATADTSQATARCFTTGRLEVDAPPAAAVLGTTYFYGDAGMLYAVHNVHTDAAVFEAAGFDFRDALVRDVAPVSSYLVGVSDGATSLIVVKADFTGHAALAIDDAVPGVAFDAAFAFDEGVYVAGSDNILYKVDVDLTTIDDNCWADSGEDAPACAATATLSAAAPAPAGTGSGTNCAGTLDLGTAAPSSEPAPVTPGPSSRPTSARPTACPTPSPSAKPTTAAPSAKPTAAPSASPTHAPSLNRQLVSAAVVLEFDEAEYSEDLGLAVGDALVQASPSVVACNGVTFSTTQRRRLAAETRTAEAVLVVDGGADIDTVGQELSDAVSNGDFATALVDAVATYPSLDAIDASNAVQVTASLEALEAISEVVPTPAPVLTKAPVASQTPAPVADATPGPSALIFGAASPGNNSGGGADTAGGSLQIILGVVFAAVGLVVCGGAKWYHDREKAKDARRLERWDDVERELAAKEPDWASPAPGGLGDVAVEEDKVHVQDSATKALYGSPDPPAPKRSFNPFSKKQPAAEPSWAEAPEPSWAAPPAAAPPPADDAWPAAAAPSSDDDSWPSADAPPVREMSPPQMPPPDFVPPPDVDGLPLPPPPPQPAREGG